jgi:hypothetical protein
MTSSAQKWAATRHLLAGGALVAVLVGFGQTWSVITLTTGHTVSLTGNQQAPLALSLLLVTGAAYALSLLLYHLAHRLVTAVQSVAALGASWAVVASLDSALERARADITLSTGLSGQDTIGALVASVETASFPVGISLVGCGLFAASALIGLGMRRVREKTPSRFDRPDTSAMGDPWDELSDGVDPTDR